jgi:hypothetical protein
MARARRRYLAFAPRSGPTAIIAIILAALIVAVAVYLEMRGQDRDGLLRRHVSTTGTDPVAMVVAAGRSHRIMFLSDVAGSGLPKRYAGDVIEGLAQGPGVDAVVVDVDLTEQPWLDIYFESDPEDASVFVTHPRALRSAGSADPDMLDLYHRIWQLNKELGAVRRINVVAGDAEGWPPVQALSPAQAVSRYANRDVRLMAAIEDRVLARDARARVVVFADGLRVLRGRARLQTGGASLVTLTPAAALAAARFPGEVYSVLVDVPAARGFTPDVAAYRGTGAWDVLRRLPDLPDRVGVPVNESFGSAEDMLRIVTRPGISFTLESPGALLSSFADAYIFLSSAERR